jgi:FAD/FMN-containing dehydrogenase
LVASLYAAGRPEYRAGPADPAPGVASVTAVMPRLALKGLDQVVEVNRDERWVLAQGRCGLDGLEVFLARRGLALASAPAGPLDAGRRRAERRGRRTVGAAVIAAAVGVVWADVLTKDGEVTRHGAGALPPDGLVVGAALRLAP